MPRVKVHNPRSYRLTCKTWNIYTIELDHPLYIARMSFFSSESKHNTLSDEQNCFLPRHLSFWELPGRRGRAYLCAEDVVFALHSGCSKDDYQWVPVHCRAGEGAPSSDRTKSLQFCLRRIEVELKERVMWNSSDCFSAFRISTCAF